MITIPDFLTFLANNTIIALLALVAWIFVVSPPSSGSAKKQSKNSASVSVGHRREQNH